MRAQGAPASLAPIPSFAFPESAALALARVTNYGRWLARPISSPAQLPQFHRDEIRGVVDEVVHRGGGWVTPEESARLLAAAGIESAPSKVAITLEDAVRAGLAVGYPLALKALGPTLLHKTERRAVALNVADEVDLRAAYADFTARFKDEMTAVLVQRMVPSGVEMIVGAVHDPLFGPLIACGTGGVMVDVLADTAFRLHPISVADATDMINELRGSKLLRGFRGTPPADSAALSQVLLRVSELVTAAPEIQELDLNPVIVLTRGACVADVRVRIAARTSSRRGRRVQY
jgi:acyl-CoA synthetase (NDP forming)